MTFLKIEPIGLLEMMVLDYPREKLERKIKLKVFTHILVEIDFDAKIHEISETRKRFFIDKSISYNLLIHHIFNLLLY